MITGRKADVLEDIATRIRNLAPPSTEVLAWTADITNEASVVELYAAAKEAIGKIDILINSAASLNMGPVGIIDAADFFTDFQVNVLGTYRITHQFLAQAEGAGTIISLITGAIGGVFPGMAGYTASKLALVRIMENLHAEQSGIRVFSLIPGIVPTKMTLDAFWPYAKDTAALSGSWTLFLSSPRAEWLRGGIVSVNCESPIQSLKVVNLLTRIEGDIEEMEAHKDQIVSENLLSRAFLHAKLGKGGHPWS